MAMLNVYYGSSRLYQLTCVDGRILAHSNQCIASAELFKITLKQRPCTYAQMNTIALEQHMPDRCPAPFRQYLGLVQYCFAKL